MPQPEIYVLYTEGKKDIPLLTLRDEFFKGKETAVDIRIKMLYGDPEDDIIGQYVLFIRILKEQIAKFGRKKKAVQEAIHICQDKDVLKEWLISREGEVMDIFDYLYDEEIVRKTHEAHIEREAEARGRNNLMQEMLNKGFITQEQVAQLER